MTPGTSGQPHEQDGPDVLCLLFTDIESSTRLAQRLGASWPVTLQLHNSLIREAVGRHAGRVVDNEGDSFFAVFDTSDEGVAAALAAQTALGSASWPQGVTLRARMGVHVGPVARGHDGGYVGVEVHRAARVAAGGHGGQVLVTSAAADRLARCPDGATLAALGVFVLKDFDEAIRLFELRHPSIDADRPALRLSPAARHNLPRYPSAFIGREAELEALGGLLDREPMVTIVGPGGSGKTRCAVDLALGRVEAFDDGVRAVLLAEVDSTAGVVAATAAALGVREEPGAELLDTILRHLADRELLLVLDNCEHVHAAAAEVAASLLAHCPRVKLLVTSRAPLGIAGECLFVLPPLGTPGNGRTLAEVADADAVRLFVARARSVQQGFEVAEANVAAVARLCNHLDGLPLALEIAAARLRSLSIFELSERLSDTLDLLTTGDRALHERQRTMRATIEWSHQLLTVEARRIFRRLAVFRGGWELTAAEMVCAMEPVDRHVVLPSLAELVDQGLVVVSDSAAGRRYKLLEVVREYADHLLHDSGETAVITTRHAVWLEDVLSPLPGAMRGPHQEAWVQRLDAESPNIEAVIAHRRSEGDAPAVAALLHALADYWIRSGDYQGRRSHLDWVLERRADLMPDALGWALVDCARFESFRSVHEALAKSEQAAELFRARGDLEGLTAALSLTGFLRGIRTDDVEGGRTALEEGLSLAHRRGDLSLQAECEQHLGRMALVQGALSDARAMLQASYAHREALGDRRAIAESLECLAELAAAEGDDDAVRELCGRCLSEARVVGDLELEYCALEVSGWYAVRLGQNERALRLLQEALSVVERMGSRHPLPRLQVRQAAVLELLGRRSEALDLLARAGSDRSPRSNETWALRARAEHQRLVADRPNTFVWRHHLAW